jgi:transcriptional regulator with XRE-family HTH domain
MADDQLVGERIAYHRKRLGLSQVEFAGLVGRSESWVSQVERGVRPVDRMSVLQRVADVLSVSVAELRGNEEARDADQRPEAFDNHPTCLDRAPRDRRGARNGHSHRARARDGDPATARWRPSWPRSSRAWRPPFARPTASSPGRGTLAWTSSQMLACWRRKAVTRPLRRRTRPCRPRELLGDTYQAVAALMVKIGETDAAWIAGRRGQHVPHGARVPGLGPD